VSGSRRDRVLDLSFALLIGVLVLGPVLWHRGFAMRGDMVLVPHQPWKDAWLALDGSAPRFVPGDAVVWALTAVLPGDLVQKLLLLGALVLAGVGAGLLVRDRGLPGRAAAIVLCLWNPWVLERLSIGQWGSVLGYAALPHLVVAAARFRAAPGRSWPVLTLWLGFTALWSPASAVLGALTALCVVVVARRIRPVLVTAGISVLVNLPWLVPALVNSDRLEPPGAQFDSFTVRAESGAGLLASVLSLGGIWKASVVPGERTVAVIVLLSCLSTVLAVVGLWRGRRDADRDARLTRTGLAGLAVVVTLLAVLPAVPFLTDGFDAAAERVAALSALRDGHRFLGAAVLVLLPGLAWFADRVWAGGRAGAEALRAVAVVVALLPALCLPSMVWGLGGDLRPVTYPAEWFRAKTLLEADVDERGGATVVLPWRGTYRGYAWNGSRAQLDPAPRFFAGDVLIDDRIYLPDRVLDNEDPRLARITAALAGDDPAEALAEEGVARVLVEKGNGVRASEVPEGEVLHDGPLLTVVATGSPDAAADQPGPGRRAAVVAGDLLAGLVLLVSGGCILRRRVYGERAVDSGRGTE